MRREIHYRHFYRTGRLLSNRKPCRFRLWPEDSAFGEDSALAGFRLKREAYRHLILLTHRVLKGSLRRGFHE